MSSKVLSAAVTGLDSQIIEVETDVSYGLRCFNIVGLPDKAVEESKERVDSAIKSSGFAAPHRQAQRVLVNLAPADLKKEGSLYDLPIALGYLLSSNQTKFINDNKVFIGELSLDGGLRPVKGALVLALTAKEKGIEEIILPLANAPEAALVSLAPSNNSLKEFSIIGVNTLKEAIDYIEGRIAISPFKINEQDFLKEPPYQMGLGLVKGQELSKRALEIAAAGGHNLFMEGPPGSGKTLLAKTLPSILPKLSIEESLEVTKIYSIAGFLPKNSPLINFRPFRAPHHASSEAALLGGGSPPRPGEITLAHRGVLFLDEFPEFHRDVLESLRQPIEEGEITILRAKEKAVFPSRFALIAASNPCPCGNFGNPEKTCQCLSSQILKYKRKLSGPLMDRLDIFIEVPPVKFEKLIEDEDKNFINKLKKKINQAREIQGSRFLKESNYSKERRIFTNAEMDINLIKKYCQVDLKTQNILRKFVDSAKLSARGYHRVLKTARTIADLEASENILYDHVTEALMYRIKEN